jgi:hypothetical protein
MASHPSDSPLSHHSPMLSILCHTFVPISLTHFLPSYVVCAQRTIILSDGEAKVEGDMRLPFLFVIDEISLSSLRLDTKIGGSITVSAVQHLSPSNLRPAKKHGQCKTFMRRFDPDHASKFINNLRDSPLNLSR